MTKTHPTIAKIVATVRQRKDENGRAEIYAKECASILRVRLREAFPGIKFSVRSDYDSINIYWDNGPAEPEVDALAREYQFGGFDGMIDLAYHADNWLYPDGSMSAASCEGTVGSMGTVAAYQTDCPEPGAFLVRHGPRYVFTSRTVTDWEAVYQRTLRCLHRRYVNPTHDLDDFARRAIYQSPITGTVLGIRRNDDPDTSNRVPFLLACSTT